MVFSELDSHGNKAGKMILEDETYAIVGAAMEVYYKLGAGFGEPVIKRRSPSSFRSVVFLLNRNRNSV